MAEIAGRIREVAEAFEPDGFVSKSFARDALLAIADYIEKREATQLQQMSDMLNELLYDCDQVDCAEPEVRHLNRWEHTRKRAKALLERIGYKPSVVETR